MPQLRSWIWALLGSHQWNDCVDFIDTPNHFEKKIICIFFIRFFNITHSFIFSLMQMADLQTISQARTSLRNLWHNNRRQNNCLIQAHSSSLPPNPPNPACPSSHILPLHQALNREPVLGQLLISRTLMHKAMTSPTQPCHTIQFPLFMPSPLEDLGMHRFRNQVVI